MKKKMLILLMVVFSINTYSQENVEKENIEVSEKKNVLSIEYYNEAKEILKKYPKSKITAEDLYQSAAKVYQESGIIVPVKLAISQGIMETGLGTMGVGKSRNNPYSIYSSKNKGYKNFTTLQKGIESYYYLISSNYLIKKTVDELLVKFVNKNNKRYASDLNYEKKIRKLFHSL